MLFTRRAAAHSNNLRVRQRAAQMRTIRSMLSSWTAPSHIHSSTDSSCVKSEEDQSKYRAGGYHPVRLDEIFDNRYKILSKLGFGRYSTVWLVQDLSCYNPGKRYAALKILTADSYGTAKPIYELAILEHIKQIQPDHPGYERIVHLQDTFSHNGPNGSHICLILDLLGQDVFSMMKSLPKFQFTAGTAKRLSIQMLQALDWLHNSCNIIHTDVKPGNILMELSDVNAAAQNHVDNLSRDTDNVARSRLVSRPIMDVSSVSQQQLKFKLTDFGVSSWGHKHLTEWIQPPSLRAPEVFLGAPWGFSVDLWSLACLIYELVQGRTLFMGRPGPEGAWTAEEDQLAQMIELFGPVPMSLIAKGLLSKQYFDESGNLLHIKQLYPIPFTQLLAQTNNDTLTTDDYQRFEEFLRGALQYDESGRKSAAELLDSSWLRQAVDEQ